MEWIAYKFLYKEMDPFEDMKTVCIEKNKKACMSGVFHGDDRFELNHLWATGL